MLAKYVLFTHGNCRHCWDEDAQQMWRQDGPHPERLGVTFAQMEKFVPMGITKVRRTKRRPKWVPIK